LFVSLSTHKELAGFIVATSELTKSASLDLSNVDPDLADVLEAEGKRQIEGLELIASENYTSEAVMEAVGSIFTNKYAEGYPGKRYYGGCINVDVVEDLARDRLLQLMGGEHANVQPHSGSVPNMAVYMSMLDPGDTLMGMRLEHGGHLTHGHPKNFSGALYNVVGYGVNPDTETIDYENVRRLALEHRPKLIVSGSTAYPRLIDFAKFREIADEVGALHMTDMAHISGLVAGGSHPSPVPYADFVTSSTHKSLRGPRGGFVICKKEWAKQIDGAMFPGIQGGPFMNVIAGKAVAFKEALQPEFKEYSRQVVSNAQVLADELIRQGMRLVSDGTDNHLMLIDLGPEGPSGKKMQSALEIAGITTNKNTVPRETRKAFVTSGIRLGTPALTTRGFGNSEMEQIAVWIRKVFQSPDDFDVLQAVHAEVSEMAEGFPVPGISTV